MNETASTRAERGARLVGLGIIVSRVAGLVRSWVMGRYIGAGMEADAYNAAIRIPNAIRNLLGDGAISASFVPVYAAALARGDERGAKALANALLGVLLASVSALTLIGIAAAPLLTALLVPGAEGVKAELTTTMMRVLFPMTGLMVLSGWCLGIQNGHRRFFIAYASAAMWSFAQIAMLVIGGIGHHRSVAELAVWLSWGTLIGSILQIAAQAPQVIRLVGGVRPTLDTNAPGLRETLVNFVPVVGALGLAQISSMTDTAVVSYLGDGPQSWLSYASQIYLLPLSLFGVAAAVASLPEMARERAQGRAAEFGKALSIAWERVLFYTIPSAIAFVAIGDYIIALLLQSGRFTAENRERVHIVLASYALGLVAYSLARVLASMYQALQQYRKPLIAACWAIGTSITISVAVVLPLREYRYAVVGLGLASAIGAHVNLSLLWRGAREALGDLDMTAPKRVAWRSLGAAVVAAGVSLVPRYTVSGVPVQVTALIAIAAFCATYLGTARLLGLEEASRLTGSVLRRIGL